MDQRRSVRSIPACTGNPTSRLWGPAPGRVYPRVYGESFHAPLPRKLFEGLSPRVRGIRIRSYAPIRRCGSIPACTGNPSTGATRSLPGGVYPRVYGESVGLGLGGVGLGGLSPRVRGILPGVLIPVKDQRSIPACTGNPSACPRGPGPPLVYPRVYGESAEAAGKVSGFDGLSPRVRGIRVAGAGNLASVRSIPACTGNPGRAGRRRARGRVYPRVYGESTPAGRSRLGGGGLSPRVRGILQAIAENGEKRWSIPACTGNPYLRHDRYCLLEVYPRVYGESIEVTIARQPATGLSPRVRGIRRARMAHRPRRRSIPACTGNPGCRRILSPRSKVYPRVYGESQAWPATPRG